MNIAPIAKIEEASKIETKENQKSSVTYKETMKHPKSDFELKLESYKGNLKY